MTLALRVVSPSVSLIARAGVGRVASSCVLAAQAVCRELPVCVPASGEL